jgi:hypothetical protein
MKPLLVYHAELTNDGDPHGRLELWDLGEYPIVRALERYIALSGLPGWQAWEDQDAKARGPLPRPDKAKIPCYQVATKPHWVSAADQPGIAGNFYDILPSFVDNDRGLFGIHFDANVLGTAGCVGIKNAIAWADFQDRMTKIAALGIEKIPLMVGYS